MGIKTYFYKLNQIKKDEFIAYTHLGLGDHIICNGLINYLSKNYKNIYLPVKSRDINTIEFLYSKNSSVIPFQIEHESEVRDILTFAKMKELEILKIGFEKRKPPFNLSFYKQFKIPYSVSIDFFNYPNDDKKESELFNYLIKFYNVSNKYQLVHNQSSYGKVNLEINLNLSTVYVDKETDIFKNIFFYKKIINQAQEIHCLDSSFLHLVERIDTNAKLFFHKVKKVNQESANVHLIKKWNEINYIN